MKYTLCITLACNMSCSYCYIKHNTSFMSDDVAAQSVDFMYNTTPRGDRIEIGFFGGEPLMHFDIVEKIIRLVYEHPEYAAFNVDMILVTNATLLTDEIISKLVEWGVGIGVSCDGPPIIHDRFRCFKDGSPTSALIEKNLIKLAALVPGVMVNAVYRPETVSHLVQSIEYFSSLGVRRIILSPDYSARWTNKDISRFTKIYDAVGKRYCEYYRIKDHHYISLIDSKIPVIIRGGYQEKEQCSMGKRELAISPQGNLFPCDRLIGDGSENGHCFGNLKTGPLLERMNCRIAAKSRIDTRCEQCELRQYCVNWCGCSNYFATGFYNQVSDMLCASERASLQAAMNVMEGLGNRIYSPLGVDE